MCLSYIYRIEAIINKKNKKKTIWIIKKIYILNYLDNSMDIIKLL